MRYNELFNESGPIPVDTGNDYGSAEGYVVSSKAEQLPNWLQKHGINDDHILNEIRADFEVVAILNNINVTDTESRGQGHGAKLFDDFYNTVCDLEAQAILLIADTAEDQDDDFDLVAWYERLGFDKVADTGSGPFMILSLI